MSENPDIDRPSRNLISAQFETKNGIHDWYITSLDCVCRKFQEKCISQAGNLIIIDEILNILLYKMFNPKKGHEVRVRG